MIVGGDEMVPISIVICSKNESLVMHREREGEMSFYNLLISFYPYLITSQWTKLLDSMKPTG